MRRLLACVVLAGLASPAVACLNDIELPSHEREFRSQYARSERPQRIRSNESTRYWLVLGVGAALLTGGVFIAVTGGRSGT